MTNFGKIKSYQIDKGTGTITPEKGGGEPSFRKSDLQQEGQVPQQNDRYGSDIKEAGNGRRYAKNLVAQLGEPSVQEEQARAQQG